MLNTILGARLLSWHFANGWVFEPAIEMGTASTATLANRSPFKRAEFGSLIRMAVSAVFIGLASLPPIQSLQVQIAAFLVL
jgi:hypothetical protein